MFESVQHLKGRELQVSKKKLRTKFAQGGCQIGGGGTLSGIDMVLMVIDLSMLFRN